MALLPRVANEMKAQTGYTFATIALGGTSPRGWYYELRAVDPSARAYAAIVIPSDDYDEPDGPEDLADRETDPYYLVNRLQLRDLLDFPWSYRDNKLRWRAVESILLKGLIYKRDFLEFLTNPAARLAQVRLFRDRPDSVHTAASRPRTPDGLFPLLVWPYCRSLPRFRHEDHLSASAARPFPRRIIAQAGQFDSPSRIPAQRHCPGRASVR